MIPLWCSLAFREVFVGTHSSLSDSSPSLRTNLFELADFQIGQGYKRTLVQTQAGNTLSRSSYHHFCFFWVSGLLLDLACVPLLVGPFPSPWLLFPPRP